MKYALTIVLFFSAFAGSAQQGYGTLQVSISTNKTESVDSIKISIIDSLTQKEVLSAFT